MTIMLKFYLEREYTFVNIKSSYTRKGNFESCYLNLSDVIKMEVSKLFMFKDIPLTSTVIYKYFIFSHANILFSRTQIIVDLQYCTKCQKYVNEPCSKCSQAFFLHPPPLLDPL